MIGVAPVSGTIVDTAALKLAGLELADVWHAYARIERWHGSALGQGWTVADHVLAGMPFAERAGVAAHWLLHEAAEAIALGDIASPMRTASYNRAEDRILRAALEHFGLSWPMPDEVKIVDKRMAATELRLLHPRARRAIRMEAQPYRSLELRHRSRAAAERELARAAARLLAA